MITGLTPLRGIAALLVVLFHYHLFIARLIPQDITHLVEKLYLMVDLFFVLSGFVIYHVYGNYFRQGITTRNFIQFFHARFARIYPLHLFSLGLMLLLYGVMWKTNTFNAMFNVTYDPSAIIPQLLLLQGMGTHQEATWNSPAWSISVEWWAYMCFPLFTLLLAKTTQWARWVLISLVIAGYLAIIFYFQPEFWRARWALYGIPESVPFPMHTLDVLTGAAFLRCLCGFVLGMLLYERYLYCQQKGWFSSGWWSLAIIALLATGWHLGQLNDLFAVGLFALLILNIALNDGKWVALLECKPLHFLGEISYTLYLIHIPVLFAYIGARRILLPHDPADLGLGYAMSLADAWLLCAGLLSCILALSLFTYYCVEKPSRHYLRRTARSNSAINSHSPIQL